MNISLLVKVGVEVGVVKEELGGGELVEGAMQLLRCFLCDSMLSVLKDPQAFLHHLCHIHEYVPANTHTLRHAGVRVRICQV